MLGTINVEEFAEYLKANNLLIIDRHEYQRAFENDTTRAQTNLLKKRSATLSDIAKSGILQVSSKQALRKWIASGIIRSDEWYKNPDGIIMVDIAGVKRIVKEKDLHI